MNNTKETDLQIVHRLMRDLESFIVPGQYDLQHSIVLALSALATNIKQQAQIEPTQPCKRIIKPDGELAI